MFFVGPALRILAVAIADAKNIANAKYVGRHVVRKNFNVYKIHHTNEIF